MPASKIYFGLSRKWIISIICIILSAILIRLSRPGFDYWLFAWIGFVPLLWITQKLSPIKAFYFATISLWMAHISGVFWFSYLAKHFIGLVVPLNYILLLLFSLMLGCGYGLIFYIYRLLTIHSKIPQFLIFPVSYVCIWQFYPQIFKYSFAETQINFPIALQATDITGSVGINFIIMMVNGLILTIINGNWRWQKISFISCWLIVAIWFSYGIKQYFNWQQRQLTWESIPIGFVQPNRPAGLSWQRTNFQNLVQPWELEQSVELAKKGAKLVIWPEGNMYFYNSNKKVQEQFQATTKKYDFDLFLTETTTQQDPLEQQPRYYNSVVWIKKNGDPAEYYHKNILVPFGEYLPGEQLTAKISQLVSAYTPGYSAGKKQKIFTTDDVSIVPAICYESLFDDYIAKQASLQGTKKFILVVSQDGWYNSRLQTTEHSYITMLRAIENRLPILHVVQNGFSSLGLPNGEYKILSQYQQQQAVIFDLLAPPDNYRSFFSKYPKLFRFIAWALLTLIIITALLNYWRPQLKTKQ